MKLCVLLSAFMLLALPVVAPASDAYVVLRVSDGSELSFKDMTAELVRSRVIFVGEIHDVPADHQLELDVLRAVHAAGVRLIIGLEMFRAESQPALDRWVAGSLDETSFRKFYAQNWNEPWHLYRDILLYARDKKIPLIGLNVDAGIAGKVARSGFSSLTPRERAKLPSGITCDIDQIYEAFIRSVHGESTRSPGGFRHFCEAQMLWDSAMAHTLAGALARYPGRSAVVLAGSGHAWRRGIPTQLSRIMPDLRSIVVLPEDESGMITRDVTRADADFVVY
jgi:uncharacterized iron-regulated protein